MIAIKSRDNKSVIDLDHFNSKISNGGLVDDAPLLLSISNSRKEIVKLRMVKAQLIQTYISKFRRAGVRLLSPTSFHPFSPKLKKEGQGN